MKSQEQEIGDVPLISRKGQQAIKWGISKPDTIRSPIEMMIDRACGME